MMKVALLAESMADYAGEFANALAGRCSVSLIAPSRVRAAVRPFVSPQIQMPDIDWPRLRSPRNALFLAQLIGLLRELKPDVIHVVSQSLTWPALVMALRGEAVLVQTVHDVEPHPGDTETRKIPPQFGRILRAQADAFVTHSEALKSAAARRFAMPPERIFVVPHIALSRYQSFRVPQSPDLDEDVFDVLFFGRIYLYKGLEHLIAAAEALDGSIPGLRVTIAGQGDDLARCRAMIRTPRLFDIREGFIPDAEAAALFARTQVVALPYIEASQSGVTALAIAFGKPVVATDVGDFAESIGGVDAFGILVPPRDPVALAGAIRRLYECADIRLALGEAARRAALGPRSAALVGERMVAAYRVMQTRGRNASQVRAA